MDQIREFSHAEGDRIDLSKIDPNRCPIGKGGLLYLVELNTDSDTATDYAFSVISLDGAIVATDFIL